MTHTQVKDTLALNALKALRDAPISMGRGEIPVELRQQPSAQPIIFERRYFMQKDKISTDDKEKYPDQKMTYPINGRSFVIQPVFKKDGSNSIGNILLRLMQIDIENGK